ncbi:MAG: hypothetical protein KDB27_23470 [Planctomycetales bacterium]|nr:hypothetical protein [Planctomycetales bacterium]
MNNPDKQNRERDSATLRVLGIFFLIMGSLVLAATYEAIGNVPAVIVSVISGLVLLGVGIGMIGFSWRLSRNID